MQVEFQKAIAGLKSSRLGHRGSDALGVLPWYIIIGPPGAGKTTALRSSGLQFPYAKGGKVKGVGGTRNCDWWLTNEAIILDTAGRWSTQDDDHEEWLAFLDLLRKTRPKKPVNGILLAVSLLDLEGGEEEMSALAKALRDRLDEVTGRLDMVVPVYLLVTKADLVPGFVEMFGDLRDKRSRPRSGREPAAHGQPRRTLRDAQRAIAGAVRHRGGAFIRPHVRGPARGRALQDLRVPSSSNPSGRTLRPLSAISSPKTSTRMLPSCVACFSPAVPRKVAPSTASCRTWPRPSACRPRPRRSRSPSPRVTSCATSSPRWCSRIRPRPCAARGSCARNGCARSASPLARSSSQPDSSFCPFVPT